MDDRTEWKIGSFFNYWRHRAEFVGGLPLPERQHEANVLVNSAIDSLAKLWDQALGLPHGRQPQARRFGRFLVECAFDHTDSFQRISIPYVRWRATVRPPTFGQDVVRALQGLRAPAGPPDAFSEEARRLRRAADDPNVAELLDHDLSQHTEATASGRSLHDWLLDSRYGEVLYREFRCSWVHEGRGGAASHSFDVSDSEPTYMSNDYSTPPRLGFSIPYLVKVLNNAIDGFERVVREDQLDPVPEPHLPGLDIPESP